MSEQAIAIAKSPAHARAGLQALYDGGYIPGKLAEVDPLQILARYLSDESTKDIAASYGCTRQALGYFLLSNAGDEWREAQVARAIARKELADDEMEGAQDALALARARERLKSAQWDLERLLSRLYGAKQEVSHTGQQPALQITIIRPLIDA